MKVKIELKLSCFAPTIIMEIEVPYDRDEEEYIDELLESILAEEFRYNAEWDFAEKSAEVHKAELRSKGIIL
jgi:hypothetical protein